MIAVPVMKELTRSCMTFHNFGYICRDILALGFSKVAVLKRLVYRKASALKLNFDEFAVCLFLL